MSVARWADCSAVWLLLRPPTVFRRYCLSSPALWWDEGVIFDDESAYAAAHDDLDARVYVGVGADECAAGDVQAIGRLGRLRQPFPGPPLPLRRTDLNAGQPLTVSMTTCSSAAIAASSKSIGRRRFVT